MIKPPLTKIFNGKRYSLIGQGNSQVSKNKAKLKNWAERQRAENNNSVRIVKVSGGYAGYIRREKECKC